MRLFTPRWPVALAVLIPAVPIVAGVLLISGNSSGNPGDSGVGSGTYTPIALAGTGAPSLLSKTMPGHHSGPRLPPGHGALIASLHKPIAMRSRPGGRTIANLGLKTIFGTNQVLWVARRSGNWLGVVSPQAGNGRLGWIPQSDVTLGRVNYQLDVSLSARRLTVLDSGHVVERYTIAVGKPSAPTPTGRFAVTDRLATGDPTGPYGCCILALSALAPHAIQDWSGGNRIAIHSTPETSSIGLPVSHGCMRLTLPEGQWLLDHIPLGTPAVIRE